MRRGVTLATCKERNRERTGSQAGVAHFAHLGGMAFGFILIQYWRGRLPVKPRRRLTR